MKKKIILVLSLIILVCVGICGCGESEEDRLKRIDDALQGEWRSEENESITIVYVFSQGKMEANIALGDTEVNANTGTYEIGESTIKIDYDLGEGDIVELNYSFENGILTLADNSGELHKADANKTVTNDKSNIENPTEEDIEDYALSELYEHLERVYGEYYNISESRYKIGSINSNGNKHEVKGTLYLYDDYGSLDETATFCVPLEFQGDGDVVLYDPIDVEIDY